MPSHHRLTSALDAYSRREFLRLTAASLLGLTVGPVLDAAETPASSSAAIRRPAQRCIMLYMRGGMSHLDTFDPKTVGEIAGPVKPIPTPVDGLQLAENLPLLAKQADKLAVIRGLSSNQGAHEQGEYLMRTSYTLRGTVKHPAMGAWLTSLRPRINPTLPAYVSIAGGGGHPGAGFLESRFAPLPLGNPESGLTNSTRPEGVTKEQYQKRMDLLKEFNAPFQKAHDEKQVRAYHDLYDEAVALMASRDLAAFDLKKEDPALRAAYGEGAFAQGCLLARRLVENDVRLVEVALGGWDTHDDNFDRVADNAAILDRALSTLLGDLEARGLLDSTLVVLATEFGRSPRINGNQGRDHYPKVFSGVLAGGPVRGGQAHGVTDERGSEAVKDRMLVPDFNATIGVALGLPLDKVIISPAGRPFTFADKGQPAMGLLRS